MSSGEVYKIILIGDGGVGKTSLKNRYLGKGFKHDYMMTLGSDFSIKRIGNDLLHIWDVTGQPAFRFIRKNYYKGTSGSILVFDIVNHDSFTNLDKWIEEIVTHNDCMVPSIIISNKVDLLENREPAVTDEEVINFKKQLDSEYGYKFPFVKTSALSGFQVNYAFNELISEISKNNY